MRGVTLRHRIDGGLIVFQPALPMRGVTKLPLRLFVLFRFQPALPMRGVTPRMGRTFYGKAHFNPHSPCGE